MDQTTQTPPQTPTPGSAQISIKSLEGLFEEYLVKKAPFQLPPNVKEILVKIAPWLAILGIIITLPAILVFLGLGSFAFTFGAATYGWYYPSLILAAVIIVLEALAIPGLFKRNLKAWHLLFYATLVQLLSGLLHGGIIGALIGTLISLYLLFQVKELYKA